MLKFFTGLFGALKIIWEIVQFIRAIQKQNEDAEMARKKQELQEKADARKLIEDEINKGNLSVERKKKLLEELAKNSN